MEISICSHLDSNTVIAAKLCAWHDSCAVVACAKICWDLMPNNRITARQTFEFRAKKILVKWAPGLTQGRISVTNTISGLHNVKEMQIYKFPEQIPQNKAQWSISNMIYDPYQCVSQNIQTYGDYGTGSSSWWYLGKCRLLHSLLAQL